MTDCTGRHSVLQISRAARIPIPGQATGRKAHASGIPFQDASGDHLRDWLSLDRETYFDATRVAILPMGFCFTRAGKTGDLCLLIRLWHVTAPSRVILPTEKKTICLATLTP